MKSLRDFLRRPFLQSLRGSAAMRRAPSLRVLESLEDRRLLAVDFSSEPIVALEARLEAGPAAQERVAGEIVIGFRAGARGEDVHAVAHAYGLTNLKSLYMGADLRSVQTASLPEQAVDRVLRALQKNPLVAYAEPNFVASAFFAPNDPLYAFQWHMQRNRSGSINAEAAWDVTSGQGATVAVLDTGVAYENRSDATGTYYVAPDLAGTKFVPGYDFINNDPHANDDHSHGTHVAGTIAQSTNNSLGVSGVAYGASIMPVKVLGADGSGSHSSVAQGIRWAADQGAHILNLSLGASVGSTTMKDALAYAYSKGVTIIAAAGNDGVNAVSYPAAYDDYVIAVSASRFDEAIAGYSNYGSSIDLAAPGGDTSIDQNGDGYADGVLQNTFNPGTKNTADFAYYFFQGTSMASPHVAGVAALVASQLLVTMGSADPLTIRSILQATARDKGAAGTDIYYGHGVVDAAAAVLATVNTEAVFTVEDIVVNEGDGTGTLTISVSKPLITATAPITVNYTALTASTPDDFAPLGSQTVTFGPGNTTPKTVTFSIVDDLLLEGLEGFGVNLTTAFAGGPGLDQVKVNDTAVVGISDNDAATLVINEVKVGSSNWGVEFNDFADNTGAPVGQRGYSIPTGVSQSSVLRWFNINQLFVKFSDDPDASTLTPANFVLHGLQGASTPSVTLVTYDVVTNIAKLTLSGNITNDRLRIEVKDAVTQAGNPLDGEWSSGVSDFASGNGTPGGSFNFLFNVLPGDVSDSANVTIADAGIVYAAQGAFTDGTTATVAPNGETYTIFKDVNGSGNITTADAGVAFSRQAFPVNVLPAGSPGELTHASGGSVVDNIDSVLARFQGWEESYSTSSQFSDLVLDETVTQLASAEPIDTQLVDELIDGWMGSNRKRARADFVFSKPSRIT